MARTHDLVWGVEEGSQEIVAFELRLGKWLGIKVKCLGRVVFTKKKSTNTGLWWEGEWDIERTEKNSSVAGDETKKERDCHKVRLEGEARGGPRREEVLAGVVKGTLTCFVLDNRNRLVALLFWQHVGCGTLPNARFLLKARNLSGNDSSRKRS